MRTPSIAFVLAASSAAACGGKAASSSSGDTLGNTPGDGRVAAGAAIPCPSDADLQAAVARHWQVESNQPFTIQCVAGRFGEPGYILDVIVEADMNGEGMPRTGTVILSADLTRAIVDGALDEIPWGALDSSGTTYSVHDLDRDGVDEVFGVHDYDKHGYMESSLTVFRIRGGEWVPSGDIPLSSDNSAAVMPDDPESPAPLSCESTWTVEPGDGADAIKVVVTWTDGDPAGGGCLPAGEHVFVLGDAGLAEAT